MRNITEEKGNMAAVVVIDDEQKPTEVKLFNCKGFDKVQVQIDLWREIN